MTIFPSIDSVDWELVHVFSDGIAIAVAEWEDRELAKGDQIRRVIARKINQ